MFYAVLTSIPSGIPQGGSGRWVNVPSLYLLINYAFSRTLCKTRSRVFSIVNYGISLKMIIIILIHTKKAALTAGSRTGLFRDITCLKKNQTTPRPSEHPLVMGKKMSKRSGGIKRLQIQNHFMAFKQVPRCR